MKCFEIKKSDSIEINKILINRKHEMFWNVYTLLTILSMIELTVNMKCFEISIKVALNSNIFLLTVNMKCFEI